MMELVDDVRLGCAELPRERVFVARLSFSF